MNVAQPTTPFASQTSLLKSKLLQALFQSTTSYCKYPLHFSAKTRPSATPPYAPTASRQPTTSFVKTSLPFQVMRPSPRPCRKTVERRSLVRQISPDSFFCYAISDRSLFCSLDGTSPTQIVIGTGTAAPTAAGASANGVVSISPAFLGVVASSLAALSAAFAILA